MFLVSGKRLRITNTHDLLKRFFHFNATSRWQQRQKNCGLLLIWSRELKEVGQGPEKHTIIHWTSKEQLAKSIAKLNKANHLFKHQSYVGYRLVHLYKPLSYMSAKLGMSLYSQQYVFKTSASFQQVNMQQDLKQNMSLYAFPCVQCVSLHLRIHSFRKHNANSDPFLYTNSVFHTKPDVSRQQDPRELSNLDMQSAFLLLSLVLCWVLFCFFEASILPSTPTLTRQEPGAHIPWTRDSFKCITNLELKLLWKAYG